MKLKVAVGFDKTKNEEVFIDVTLPAPAVKAIVSGVFDKLDYGQTKALITNLNSAYSQKICSSKKRARSS